VDKDAEAKLIADVTELRTDMSWVKKMLSNHYQHHEKIIIGLIISLFTTAGALVIILMGN